MSNPLHHQLNITGSIQDKILAIESSYGVKVLYACESGSRAWGFASADSDYDVRFIYARPIADYLSLKPMDDTITMMEGDLDFHGWDIRKALFLLHKMNPSLIEWIQSPIVYRDDGKTATALRGFIANHFDPAAGFHHYRSMVKTTWSEHLQQGGEVNIKKLLYAVRAAAAATWIETYRKPAPVPVSDLIEFLRPVDTPLAQEMERLIDVKRGLTEKSTILMSAHLASFLASRTQPGSVAALEKTSPERMDKLLFQILGVTEPSADLSAGASFGHR